MDKIFDVIIAVAFAVFVTQTFPVMACSNGEATTGAACSISEINSMIKNNPEKIAREAVKERDLRPVNLTGEENKLDEVDIICPGGPCLYRVLKYASK